LTGGGYIVKKLSLAAKVTYTQMSKKALVNLLETITITINFESRIKNAPLCVLLDEPSICKRLNKYRNVDFYSDDPKIFNLWRGFPYDTSTISEVNPALIRPFLNHIKVVICAGDEESYNSELKKLGWIFQNPNGHLEFATVLLGEEGAGKNTYTDVICDLWGPEWTNRNVNNMEMITESNHAEVIEWKKIIVTNEIQDLERSKASWDVMKSRITDPTYMIRRIYQASKEIRNVNNYYLNSNNENCIKMGQRDRRYDVKEVSDIYVGKIDEYFIPLHATFTDEMMTHLLKFFQDMDVSDFNPRIPPCSEIKKELQESQKPEVQAFIEEFDWRDEDGNDRRSQGMLLDEIHRIGYLRYCRTKEIDGMYKVKPQRLGVAIRHFVRQERIMINGVEQRLYFPKGSVREELNEIIYNGHVYKMVSDDDEPQSISVIKDPRVAGRVRKPAPVLDPASQSSPDSEPVVFPPQYGRSPEGPAGP
jgi:hypothetical protein